MPEFKVEELGEGIVACLSEIHTFGTDAFLLADFADIKRREKACDLCSGCGIIPLLMLRRQLAHPVTAVEIQEDACMLMKAAAEKSEIGERLNIVNADLNHLPMEVTPSSFDLITVNPPYFIVGSGYDCKDEQHRIIRSEVCCTFDDIAKQAARLLNSGGRLCVCHRPERLTDVICAMRQNKIEPKRLRFVVKNSSSAPWLFLIEGKKDAKAGLCIEKSLDMSDQIELKRIYGGYANK